MALRDRFLPTITKNVTPEATKKLERAIGEFVDKNSNMLLTLDLSKRYSFNDSDREVVYNIIGVTEAEIEEAIKESKDIYKGNKIQSNPFYVITTILAAYYLSKKDEAHAISIITYATFQMYVSQHKGFFKYGAQENCMAYTIEHLDNTYTLRQFPSLFAFLLDNSKTLINAYRDRFVKCTDKDITWIVDSNWVRIKGKLKKISQRYYENHKSGRYLNNDTDSFSEDDYRLIDNQSFAVDRLVTRVYIKLLNRQYERRFLRYSVDSASISLNKFQSLVEDIIDADTDNKRIQPLLNDIIVFFLQQSGKPISYIAKGDFIAFMNSGYGSNTEAPEMLRIKECLDKWLAENMYKYGRATYGKTVQITYRRALYMFFIFTVNYEAKVQ